MKDSRSNTQHTTLPTLSQLETPVSFWKSVSFRQSNFLVTLNKGPILSGYTQSVDGQGKQQAIVPSSEGIEAQSRPS